MNSSFVVISIDVVVNTRLTATLGVRMSERKKEPPAHGVCPVIDIDYRGDRPAFAHYASLNEVRELAPIVWNETPYGFWMVSRYDDVREALQSPEVFTNKVVSALSDPEHNLYLIPQNLNGKAHVDCRHVINPWFSPGSVKKLEPLARERCITMIEELRPAGACDLSVDFAMMYATEMFLGILGLAVEDGAFMLPRVETIFAGFFGGDQAAMATANEEIKGYFERVIADRLDQPRDITTDFVSFLMQSNMGDRPITQDEILNLCATIMLAGLDTTRSALGYIFHHLATHDDHRRMLVEHPERIPEAVEEFVRLYALVFQDGRYVDQDVDFHGCPMKQGDIVWLGLAQANRDPRMFPNPDEFDLERGAARHFGFGAGAHRCLGAHLARLELIIVLEEWLRRIPDFRLATAEPIEERGGQLMLKKVPLAWDI
jgi:cytochrome P450